MNVSKSIFFQILKRKETLIILVLLIVGVSIIGWIFDKIIIASVSLKFIPIAPSTALMFITLSILFLTNNKFEKSHTTRSINIALLFLALMFCLLIFLQYFFKFKLDIENIFIKNPETLGDVPIGRMSPITSLLLIFLCIGILGIRRYNSDIIKYIGGSFSLVASLVSSVLLIGYLYKAPLLYGSHIIPVSLPAAFCFLLFSITLLRTYELQFWSYNLIKDNKVTRYLLKSFLPLIAFIVILQGFLITTFSFNRNNLTLSVALILFIVISITILLVFKVSEVIGTQLLRAEQALKKSDITERKRADELAIANKELILQNREKEKRAAELIIANKELAFENKEKEKRAAELIIANEELAFQNKEKEKRATELINAKEHAEESDRLKSAFLTNMSHEIRTPMNGILGFTELLKEPNLSSDDQQDYIQTIQISGARMLNTINNIVDISKIESELIQVDINETNINQKMEFTYKFFKPEVEFKGLKFLFKKRLPLKEAIIKTDNEKVYGILTNLVKNAIKFTYEGSIEFGCEKKGDYLEFFVKDTGVGIPNDQEELIFERFRQGSESHNRGYEGSGLGLSIAKSYVKMLGGEIWVESEEGVGSTFYFTIPYIDVSEEKTEIINTVSSEYKDVPLRNLKILIVEDDEISYSLLTKMLQKISYEVLHAITGVQAVEACRNNRDLDLVLMDIRMPKMDGNEATRQIRQFNTDVIIIAQTAYAFSGDKERAIESGCNDYINKPINKTLLYELIKKHIKQGK